MWLKYKQKFAPYSPVILLTCLLTAAFYFLPFAVYEYNGTVYDFPGFNFLTGAVVCGGAVVVTPQPLFGVNLLLAMIVLIGTLVFRKRRPKLYGTICTLAGLLMVVTNLLLRIQVTKLLENASKPGSRYGLLLLTALGAIILVKGILVLVETKTVKTFDLMVIPGFAYLIINCYIPMFGIVLAFKEVNYTKGVFNGAWVGLDNFKFLMNDLPLLLRNTLLYNVAFIVIGNVAAITVAVFLSEVCVRRLRKFYQTSILLPNLMSIIIIAYIVYGFLGTDAGWINNALMGEGNEINFYSTKSYWPFILIIVNVWKGVGYDAIIYLSSIVGIDRSIYEAAMVDGCGRVKQIFKITLPMIKPTVVTLMVLALGRIISSDFGLFYQVPMNSGALTSVTQTIDTYVYKALTTSNNVGKATAAGAFQSLVGFVLVMVTNWSVRRADKSLSLF